ncbi:MAG: HEAT repeat domain-containing protein [Oligoflexia bacterium]|nr:HEAT repeat domain-containing protein [Oligoflexia bacterium]
MERIRDLIECHCRARGTWAPVRPPHSAVPAHTFAWAKYQYPKDRSVTPKHQHLHLTLDIERKAIVGKNEILVETTSRTTNLIEFEAAEMQIKTVLLDGKEQKFSHDKDRVQVFLKSQLSRGQTAQLTVSYELDNPRAGIYFIKPDQDYPNRATQVWTQGQDDDARYWFPCFDEPGIKCTFEMTVEVPQGFLATSNGRLISSSQSGSLWNFHWKSEAMIPAYLVTLTVGRFHEIKDDWKELPVRYLVEKGREKDGELSFHKTPKMLELFTKKLGVGFPYEKYYQVAASEFIFGGMENTSATTQTDTTLHPKELEPDFISDDLVAHELAHQWFGDLVTCKTWSHGWLNEGWATFMEYVFKEEDRSPIETSYYRYEDLKVYLGEDSGLYRRPLVTHFYTDPAEIWDRHLYQKGGLVLETLKHEIGDEDFWEGTRRYLERHRGATVETVDFQRAMEEVSGRSLQWFFDQWVYRSGYPKIKVGFEWDAKSSVAKIRFKQEQVGDDTQVFRLNTVVEIHFDDEVKKFPIEISEKDQLVFMPLHMKPKFVVLDPGNHCLKSLDWSLPQDMIAEQLKSDSCVVGKVWAMKHLAKDSNRQGIDLLIERLKTDKFFAVRGEAALALGETGSRVAKEALLAQLSLEKDSRVRSKICAGLGNFHDEDVGAGLSKIVENEKHPFVRGAACRALGKTKWKGAFEVLKKALDIASWNDFVCAAAISGLRSLRDDRALELFVEYSKYGAPKFGRLAAVEALSDYGLDRKDIHEHLETLLDDRFFRVRFAAVSAISQRKNPAGAGALDDLAHRVTDGHLKAHALRSKKSLLESLRHPSELTEFQKSLEKLQEESRKLKDELQGLKPTSDKVEKKSDKKSKKTKSKKKSR